MKLFSVKYLASILILLFSGICCLAQNSKTHIVVAGETLTSIAQEYGVGEDDIKNANPFAAKAFYVGMRLVIPEMDNNGAGVQSDSRQLSATPSRESAVWTSSKTPYPHSNTSRSSANSLDAGVIAGSDMSEVVGLSYGLFASSYGKSGLGAYASLCTNMFNNAGGDADFILKIGPSYRYDITKHLHLAGSLCYSLTRAAYCDNKALISGLSVVPSVAYSSGSLSLVLSVDAYLRNGYSGVRMGPFVGISYALK